MNNPTLRYVAPMGVFLLFIALGDVFRLGVWEHPFRVAVLCAVLWVFSRHTIDFRVRSWIWAIGVGLAVFAVWIAPDSLVPGWRSHWIFSTFGDAKSSLGEGQHQSTMVLVFRSIRAVMLVPVIEELFWRGWLVRWLVKPEFESVPLGAYTHSSFWISAVLFATEHGPYWEVGLLAGIAFNYLMIRVKSLGDCIVAHAVANGALSAFVMATGKWEFWM